ncbi:MAG TPA: haloacid dehalogenase type II [Candidatus Sulfotelmatobacter sp.]|nr:haloacid dehalogenase type II [Candidatus Sulfotelmatobacter sp.]
MLTGHWGIKPFALRSEIIATMLDLGRFEILTFDCYGTLINWEAGILPALHRILSAHSKHIDDAALLKLYGDFELHAEQPPFQRYREVLGSVVRQLGTELGFTPTAEEVRSLADSLPTWKPWPDSVTALRQLKTRFRLAILSNVDDDLFEGTRPQLEVVFDEIITAQQAQAYKPSLDLFNLALRRIKAPAHRVLHIGQSIYHDVIPAQALGLATVWVNRPSARPGVGAVRSAEAKPDMTVASLKELTAITLSV